ncbi:IS1634 family transposase [Cyclobacterium xiamenense]|uniref:IS1634 family transposase n=1 Tax=Cyclobacterium xiamenense TaxID=1297121 RepID=UPI0035D10E24
MFVRKNKNRSGSVSIQIVRKVKRKNKLIKTVGIAHTKREEELLLLLANNEIERLKGVSALFVEHDDLVVESFVESLSNDHLQKVGAELVLGRIYQKIGFPQGGSLDYFKNLVLCRLVYPGSKLKTVEYFKKHLKVDVSVYSIYRFLDQVDQSLKPIIEKTTFNYTKKLLDGRIGVVFYDMTTLYFEASEPDDYRIPGFNKDGKHQHPQIMIGLLVSNNGYPIGYQIFEGNTSETKTLIPVLQNFQKKFDIATPIVVADAALLSQANIDALQEHGYQYILGGRVKNETEVIKQQVIALQVAEGRPQEIKSKNGRLIVSYSAGRAKKDEKNREKGLKRLESKVKTGKISKQHINNRGYNKYLRLEGEASVNIDYQKYNADKIWDGLKGYITNTLLSREEIIGQYSQLWQIEKAFRISKTDLRIRPVYHRLRNRIEAHICICFAAYTVYKELERLIIINQIRLSPEKAINEIKEIKQLSYTLPKSKETKTKILKPTNEQEWLLNLEI